MQAAFARQWRGLVRFSRGFRQTSKSPSLGFVDRIEVWPSKDDRDPSRTD